MKESGNFTFYIPNMTNDLTLCIRQSFVIGTGNVPEGPGVSGPHVTPPRSTVIQYMGCAGDNEDGTFVISDNDSNKFRDLQLIYQL